MNHSFLVGRERRNPDVGQVAIPKGSSGVFYCWQRLFAAPRRLFTPALRRKSSRPLMYVETNCLYL